MQRKKTIIHITNIPTPYRINFFNNLDIYLKKNNIQLVVLYCAKKSQIENGILILKIFILSIFF